MPQPRRSLNPFALPPETSTQFVLLIVSAVVLALGLGTTIATPMVILSGGVLEDFADSLSLVDPAGLSETESQALVETYIQQSRSVITNFSIGVLLPFVLLAAVFLLSFILYRLHPKQLLRGQKLLLFSREQDARLYEAISDLAGQAGIAPVPQIYLETASKRTDGQVFGVRNNYALKLGGGVRLLLRKKPEEFKAIILHELAHIANGDIGWAYYTQALWRVVICLAGASILVGVIMFLLVPVEEIIAEDPAPVGIAGLAAQTSFVYTLGLLLTILTTLPWLALVMMITSIRAGLLRAREYYADWRAAAWGTETTLVTMLTGLPGWRAPFWQRFWMVHPSQEDRLANLKNSARLFQPTSVSLITGFLVTYLVYELFIIAFSVLYTLSVLADVARGSVFISNYQNAMPIANTTGIMIINLSELLLIFLAILLGLSLLYLITNPLGIQLQRQTLLDLTENRVGIKAYGHLVKPPALFALGFFIAALVISGPLLSIVARFNPQILWILPLAALTLAAMVWLCLVYIRFFTAWLFSTHQGFIPPRSASTQLTFSAIFMLLTMFIGLLAGPVIALVYLLTGFVELILAFHDQNPERIAQLLGIVAANPTISMSTVAEQFPEIRELGQAAWNQYSQPLYRIVLLSLGGAGLAYTFIFGITWKLFQIMREVQGSTCSFCKQRLPGNLLLHPHCPHCDQSVASWAFLPSEPQQARVGEYLEQTYRYRDMSRYQKALQVCNIALELTPDLAEAHNLQGILLEALNRPEEAQTAYQRAVELDPAFPEAAQNLAGVTAKLQPDEQRTKSEPQPESDKSLKPSDLIWPLIFPIMWGYFGTLSILSGCFIFGFFALFIGGIGWVLSKVLSERKKTMLVSISIQIGLVLLVLLLALLNPSLYFFLFTSLVIISYGLAIAWHLLTPGLGACTATLFIQGVMVLLTLLNIVSADFRSQQQLGGVFALLIHGAIIYFTLVGFRNLQKLEWLKKRSQRG